MVTAPATAQGSAQDNHERAIVLTLIVPCSPGERGTGAGAGGGYTTRGPMQSAPTLCSSTPLQR